MAPIFCSEVALNLHIFLESIASSSGLPEHLVYLALKHDGIEYGYLFTWLPLHPQELLRNKAYVSAVSDHSGLTQACPIDGHNNVAGRGRWRIKKRTGRKEKQDKRKEGRKEGRGIFGDLLLSHGLK